PRGKDAKNELWAKIKQVNTRISKLDDGKVVHYRDIGAKFLDEEGVLTKKVMPDYLHLSKEGYQIWADAIEKDVKALLKRPATARADLPPLIPRKVLFGNPVKAAPRISPDGKRLAYLAPDKNDVLQVWVQTVGKDDAVQVTKDEKRGIRIHLWTYHPDTLLYL